MTVLTLPRAEADKATTTRGRSIAFALILTTQLMLVLDATVMNVALPRIQRDLHFSAAGLAWVMDAYTLAFGGLLLLGGRLGDLIGRRRTLVGGVALFTIASLVGGLAPTAGLLLAARAMQGVGAAVAGPSAIALLTSTFTEPKERIRALAVFSGISSAGFSIGLIGGGMLTQWADWRWVMFINVPFGIAVVALTPRFVIQPERNKAGLDIPGALTATLGIGGLVYGLIHAASTGWDNAQTISSLAIGTAALVTFVLLQLRSSHPLVPLHLFADWNRSAAYVNMMFGPAAGMSTFFFLTQYLQDVRHYDALTTGFAFLPMAVTVFTMSRIIPRILPKHGPKRLAMTGMTSMIIGLLWLTQLDGTSTYWPALFGPMILVGLGIGLGMSPLNVLVMSTVKPTDAGAAGGTLQMMMQVGSALGLAVLVTVFSTAARHSGLVDGMTTAFAAAAGIAALALVVATTFRPLPKN